MNAGCCLIKQISGPTRWREFWSNSRDDRQKASHTGFKNPARSQLEEYRMFRIDGMMTVSFLRMELFFPSALNKTVAAVLPISKAGWVIVVSGGFKINAVCRLVKLITLMSSGIAKFKSLQAR